MVDLIAAAVMNVAWSSVKRLGLSYPVGHKPPAVEMAESLIGSLAGSRTGKVVDNWTLGMKRYWGRLEIGEKQDLLRTVSLCSWLAYYRVGVEFGDRANLIARHWADRVWVSEKLRAWLRTSGVPGSVSRMAEGAWLEQYLAGVLKETDEAAGSDWKAPKAESELARVTGTLEELVGTDAEVRLGRKLTAEALEEIHSRWPGAPQAFESAFARDWFGLFQSAFQVRLQDDQKVANLFFAGQLAALRSTELGAALSDTAVDDLRRLYFGLDAKIEDVPSRTADEIFRRIPMLAGRAWAQPPHAGLVLTDNRLGEVLRQVQELRAELAAQAPPGVSKDLLIELAERQGWGGNIRFASEIYVNLELPPSVQSLSRRSTTVDAIVDKLRASAGYAMHGGSGSGKTQLAVLIAHAFVGRKIYIRLGGQQPVAGLVLELALARLSVRQPGQSVQDWCESACTAIGSAGIIVLDDFPRTGGHEAIDEHFTALCAACTRTGVRLVTTAAGPLAAATRAVTASQLHEEPVPDFGEEDIRELFLAHGASETFLTSTWFSFVYRTARRHPVLLVEAARYLQARAWATDDRSFDDLFGGTFASSLDLPTVERIRETIPDERTREFLYRLKMIGWPFGAEEVQRISSVPPAIPFPLEQLAGLVGLWVQQDTDREYLLSPLVTRLSDDNLPQDLQRAIHLTLAQRIVEKRRFGPFEASKAITHFVMADDVNGAVLVLVLLVALHGMIEMSDMRDPFALTSVWAGMPLPAAIALEKRIYLRSLQAVVRDRLWRDCRYELADLERLLAEGQPDERCQLAIVGSGAVLATYLGEKEPELAIRAMARSTKAARRMAPSTGVEAGLDIRTGVLTLLWMIAAWIRTDEEYRQWFEAVRELTPDELARWTTIQEPMPDESRTVISANFRVGDKPGVKWREARLWPIFKIRGGCSILSPGGFR